MLLCSKKSDTALMPAAITPKLQPNIKALKPILELLLSTTGRQILIIGITIRLNLISS